MRIVKPAFVNYQQSRKDPILNAIYSVHIHPAGKKFATSGGSDKHGIVTIWNMDPVRLSSKEGDENCPKILFSDNSHLKCVNCVRWSPNGRYLASGSVDTLIFIWVQRKLNDLERQDKKNHESYRTAFQLRGHMADVIDLAWSPQGNYLCSGSVDNKIVIWNAESFPEKVAVLSGHSSIVKGVCWDPVGRYLASQSEDHTLRIWRTTDWKEEKKLQYEDDGTMHFYSFNRLSWSPDGANIAATGTKNNGAPTSQVYNRHNWSKGVDMIGHRQHIICARFFPRLLRTKKDNADVLVLALGSKDRILSVWTTQRHRPLVVLRDLFTDAVLDITWNVDSFELIASSFDGSVGYLQFTEDELGIPYTNEEMFGHIEKCYGAGFIRTCSNSLKSKTDAFIVPESSAVLELQRKQNLLLLQDKKPSISSVVVSERPSGPKEQITHKTETGKRRITPKFLSTLDDDDIEADLCPTKKGNIDSIGPVLNSPEINCVKPSPTDEKVKVSSKVKSVLEEKFLKADSPALNSDEKKDGAQQQPNSKVSSKIKSVLEEKFLKADPPTLNSDEKKDGVQQQQPKSKIRVPLKSDDKVIFDYQSPKVNACSSSTSEQNQMNKSTTPISTEQNLLKEIESSKPTFTITDTNNDSKLVVSVVGSNRRSLLYKTTVDKLSTDFIKPLDVSTIPTFSNGSVDESPKKQQLTKDFRFIADKRFQITQTVMKHNSSLLCLLPGTTDAFVVKVVYENQRSVANSSTVISKENGCDVKICKLCVYVNEQKLWDVTFPRQISALVHFKDRLFVGDVNGGLHSFNIKGGRFMPPLVLDSGLTNLVCDGRYLFAVTCKATISIWTLTPFAFFLKESIAHILTDDGDKSVVKNISMTTEGNISIVFESGSSFLYQKLAGAWIEIVNNTNKVESWSISKVNNISMVGYPLGSLQITPVTFEENVKEINSSTRKDLIVDRLEVQVKLSECLDSPTEYKYWLLLLVRHLIELDEEHRVREICQSLLGPIGQTSTKTAWDPMVQHLSKREILKEILPLFALNLRMQRLYMEITDQLDMAGSSFS